MANELKIFKHEQFGSVRTMVDNETREVLFCGKDVATALGYAKPIDAVRVHCKGVCDLKTPSTGGPQRMKYIKEADIYRLVMRSNLPDAEKFQDWVCEVVLPQIRKTGGYIPVQQEDDEKTILSKAILIMQNTLEQKTQLLEAMRPKADYYDTVLNSPTCYTMTQVAKGLSMTVFELTKRLMEMHIIYMSPSNVYMLYAEHLKQGLEAYRTRSGEIHRGCPAFTHSYLVWTERGREYINRMFLKTLSAPIPNPSPRGDEGSGHQLSFVN